MVNKTKLTRATNGVIKKIASYGTVCKFIESDKIEKIEFGSIGLSHGYAGLVLVCSYLNEQFPNKGWADLSKQYLRTAFIQMQNKESVTLGLFSGITGLAFSTLYASKSSSGYESAYETIDSSVNANTKVLLRNISKKDITYAYDLDLTNGITGIGTYLLTNKNPKAQNVLKILIEILARLTLQDDEIHRASKPLPMPLEHPSNYTNIMISYGLAHGISGPLSLMSLAYKNGIKTKHTSAAIHRLSKWLCEHSLKDSYGPNWAYGIRYDKKGIPQKEHLPAQNSWCSGAPGIARALYLAGESLSEPEYSKFALDAMLASYRRRHRFLENYSPTFCHGLAGLLEITNRFAIDTGLQSFKKERSYILQAIASKYEPKTLFGYRNLEPRNKKTDYVGLVYGASGILLSILAAKGKMEPKWDRIFLLS